MRHEINNEMGLPPEEKRAVVEAVIATSNGKVTAAAIQVVVSFWDDLKLSVGVGSGLTIDLRPAEAEALYRFRP